METTSECVVVYAERVGGNVIIEFSDGKCAPHFGFHSLLHAHPGHRLEYTRFRGGI